MLTTRSKGELPGLADNLTRGLGLVKFRNVLYMPVDYKTLKPTAGLDPAHRVWVPLPDAKVSGLANEVQGILFETEAQARSYVGMVTQIAEEQEFDSDRVLIRTPQGIRELHGDGELHDLTPDFCPYYITVELNEDAAMQQQLYAQFVDWLGSEEDATSLLHHFATTLAPTWPAVRYVLLIGEGRNGKSLMMKMLVDLFGSHNVSNVTRQDMSSKSPVCHDLTNKMLNVVFDGEATYLKDSGLEKTFTAGDTAALRKLYDTHPTDIQTNGLFVEGLNREPKSSDKSTALQARIIRFHLPNVYPLNHEFERHMRSQEMLGAFLALLIQHYVKESEVVEKLAPAKTAVDMKLEHARVNNLAVQFLEFIEDKDPLGAAGLVGEDIVDVVVTFKEWRIRDCDDITPWAVPDVESLLRPMFVTERKSRRVNHKVRKVRVITGFRETATEFLDYMRGEGETNDDTMVAELDLQPEQAAASD